MTRSRILAPVHLKYRREEGTRTAGKVEPKREAAARLWMQEAAAECGRGGATEPVLPLDRSEEPARQVPRDGSRRKARTAGEKRSLHKFAVEAKGKESAGGRLRAGRWALTQEVVRDGTPAPDTRVEGSAGLLAGRMILKNVSNLCATRPCHPAWKVVAKKKGVNECDAVTTGSASQRPLGTGQLASRERH